MFLTLGFLIIFVRSVPGLTNGESKVAVTNSIATNTSTPRPKCVYSRQRKCYKVHPTTTSAYQNTSSQNTTSQNSASQNNPIQTLALTTIEAPFDTTAAPTTGKSLGLLNPWENANEKAELETEPTQDYSLTAAPSISTLPTVLSTEPVSQFWWPQKTKTTYAWWKKGPFVSELTTPLPLHVTVPPSEESTEYQNEPSKTDLVDNNTTPISEATSSRDNFLQPVLQPVLQPMLIDTAPHDLFAFEKPDNDNDGKYVANSQPAKHASAAEEETSSATGLETGFGNKTSSELGRNLNSNSNFSATNEAATQSLLGKIRAFFARPMVWSNRHTQTSPNQFFGGNLNGAQTSLENSTTTERPEDGNSPNDEGHRKQLLTPIVNR